MRMDYRYPTLAEFDSEALRSLLPHAAGECSRKTLSVNSIRENKGDRGKQRSRTFADEVRMLANEIQASGRFDAILVTKRVDEKWVCLDGHHRLKVSKLLGMKAIPAVIFQHNLK
jgi:ParB/Sulfiredoxin domain